MQAETLPPKRGVHVWVMAVEKELEDPEQPDQPAKMMVYVRINRKDEPEWLKLRRHINLMGAVAHTYSQISYKVEPDSTYLFEMKIEQRHARRRDFFYTLIR